MDKNLVALVREDTKTVKVKFFPDSWGKATAKLTAFDMATSLSGAEGKEYTYVTTLAVKPGDLCMVIVGVKPTIVEIQSVDTNLCIEPNTDMKYNWLAAVIDQSYYDKLTEQNDQLEEILRKEYQSRTRRQFREVFLAGASEDVVKQLTCIIGGNTK